MLDRRADVHVVRAGTSHRLTAKLLASEQSKAAKQEAKTEVRCGSGDSR